MAFWRRSAARRARSGVRAISVTASANLGSRSGPGCIRVRLSTGRIQLPVSRFTSAHGWRHGLIRVRFSSPTSSGHLCSVPAFPLRTGASIHSRGYRAPGSCSRWPDARYAAWVPDALYAAWVPDARYAARLSRAGSQPLGEPAGESCRGRVHVRGVVVQVDVVGGVEPEELFVGCLGALVDGVGGGWRTEVVAAAVDEQGGGAGQEVRPDRGVEGEQLADGQAGDAVRPARRRRPVGAVVVPGLAPGHGRRAVTGVDGRDVLDLACAELPLLDRCEGPHLFAVPVVSHALAHRPRVVEGRGDERDDADAGVERAVPQGVAAAEEDPDAAEPGGVDGRMRGEGAGRDAQ